MFSSQAITLFSEKLLIIRICILRWTLVTVQSSGKLGTHEKADSAFKIIFKLIGYISLNV